MFDLASVAACLMMLDSTRRACKSKGWSQAEQQAYLTHTSICKLFRNIAYSTVALEKSRLQGRKRSSKELAGPFDAAQTGFAAHVGLPRCMPQVSDSHHHVFSTATAAAGFIIAPSRPIVLRHELSHSVSRLASLCRRSATQGTGND